MAYAVVFWTQENQYSVVCTSKIHGVVAEGTESTVDWEEGKKGKKPAKIIAYPAKIIKIGGKCMCYLP